MLCCVVILILIVFQNDSPTIVTDLVHNIQPTVEEIWSLNSDVTPRTTSHTPPEESSNSLKRKSIEDTPPSPVQNKINFKTGEHEIKREEGGGRSVFPKMNDPSVRVDPLCN